ncbi:MAG: AAA family ATPase [archaeon]|nr:AAA family ATPase [archaeon]
MWASLIRIDSFGATRNRTVTLGPGLNVVYGKNEAGKSTLKSFITLSLFPKASVRYPEQGAGDSGTMDVILSDGTKHVYGRDGKKGLRDAEDVTHIDAKEYISIYSLSAESLRDIKVFEKGEIRSRFLTIPGSNDLSDVYDRLHTERNAIIPDFKRSPTCRFSQLTAGLKTASDRVHELQTKKDGDSSYNDVATRHASLTAYCEEAKARFDEANVQKEKSIRASEKRSDLEKIDGMKAQIRELEYAERYDPDFFKEYTGIVEELARIEASFKNPAGVFEFMPVDLQSNDVVKLIESAEKGPLKSRFCRFISAIGALAAAGGIGAIAYIGEETGLPLSVAGLAVLFVGMFGEKFLRWRVNRSDRKKLDGIANRLKIPRKSFDEDVALIRKAYEQVHEAQERQKYLQDRLRGIRNDYGDDETIRRGRADNEKMTDLRHAVEALQEVVKGIDLDVKDLETAERDCTEALTLYNNYVRELAEVDQIIKSIRDDRSVEQEITKKAEAEGKVYEAAFEWAQLMLEKTILDDACTEAYEKHSPEVLRMADRYLNTMTEWRYHISADPRDDNFLIQDTATGRTKDESEWSCGLEDQVKLSMKMAVANLICDERPPMILDDVLLTFDSDRKASACRSLAEMSKDMQVIYFTCDRETAELLVKEGANRLDI